MGFARLQLRSELRGGFRRWGGAIVVLALAAAAALTAATAARRTDTAFARALSSANAADANISVTAERVGPAAQQALDALERSPLVSVHARYGGVLLAAVRDGEFDPVYNTGSATGYLPLDTRAGVTISRYRILHGRAASPERADEVVVNDAFVRATGLRVGDAIADLRLLEPDDFDENGEPRRDGGTPLAVRIVGVVKPPEEALLASPLRITGTPALARRLADSSIYYQEPIRLKRGPSDLPRLSAEVERIQNRFPEAEIFVSSNREGLQQVSRAADPLVNGLWILAGLAFAVGLLLAGQSFARVLTTRSGDDALYRVVGATRGQRLRVELTSVLVALFIASLLGVALSWIVSPLTPVGAAHNAEPHRGLALNVGFALAAVAATLVVGLLTVVPTAIRVAYSKTLPGQAAARRRGRPSRTARAVGSTRLGVPAVVGTQFAFEPGHGPTATPVMGAIASLVVIVTTVTATVAFGANLDRLVTTKPLYGWNWDVAVGQPFSAIPEDQQAPVQNAPGVREMAGLASGQMTIAGHFVPAVGIDPLVGDVVPVVSEGRMAVEDDEIVLGAKTTRTVDAHLDDVIDASVNERKVRLRVVGIAAIPAFGTAQFTEAGLGTGAIGRAALFPQQDPEAAGKYNYLLLRYGPDGPTAKESKALRGILESRCSEPSCLLTDLRPNEINGFRGARSVPLAVGVALALLLVATLVHTVLSTMRRRRVDLAVLRALGCTRRQLESTMRWQTLMLTGSGLVVGIPLGLVGNKIAWSLFTDRLGVDPGIVFPVAWLALGALSVLVLGYALATGVGRRASTYARTDPFVA